jgi:hypothetical protein
VENKTGETSINQLICQYGSMECGLGVAQLSLRHGVDTQGEHHMMTSFNVVVVEIALALLNHGVNVNVGSSGGESLRKTSSYQGLEGEYHIQSDRLCIDRV